MVFNRPEHTRRAVEAIARARPPRLFLIADGPRPGRPEDLAACQAAQAAVLSRDWQCDVVADVADVNLGLRERVSSGLNWVFQHTERAIVLEDDCVAHPDFFPFCDELLTRYAEDRRIMSITGDNFQDGRRRGEAAYYFSRYPHVWGWATWRRAWGLCDLSMSFWPAWRDSPDFARTFPDRVERRYWREIFDRVHEMDSWAYPWTASVFYQGGLTATPNVNLVANIGLDGSGTHTFGAERLFRDASRLGPMNHPSTVERDVLADRHTFDHHFGGRLLRPLQHPAMWARAKASLFRGRWSPR